ncbi:MAG: 30S ribosomal protein S6 [Mycoplasmoidaceae bacterium]|nr:30S ribosomal protein S6 [Mycoplasmoidaceae bacterium]
MAKYEIMLLVDGNLDEAKSKEAIKNLTELFSEQKDYKETSLGLRDLAYKINGLSKA